MLPEVLGYLTGIAAYILLGPWVVMWDANCMIGVFQNIVPAGLPGALFITIIGSLMASAFARLW